MTVHLHSRIGCSISNIREQLLTDGYIRLPAKNFSIPDNVKSGLTELQSIAKYLPPDLTCQGNFRYRVYGKAYIYPWIDLMEPCPTNWDDSVRAHVLEYSQPASLNPENGGRQRWFAAIDRQTYTNIALRELIRFDLANVPFSEEELSGPIQIGIHLIKMVAQPGKPAIASPNIVHRDGEHFTCAHLINRICADAGANWITDPEWAGFKIEDIPPSGVRASFTLQEPLDSYIVKDDCVAHFVDAVKTTGDAAEGVRTVLLIDFTPMRPFLMMQAAKDRNVPALT